MKYYFLNFWLTIPFLATPNTWAGNNQWKIFSWKPLQERVSTYFCDLTPKQAFTYGAAFCATAASGFWLWKKYHKQEKPRSPFTSKILETQHGEFKLDPHKPFKYELTIEKNKVSNDQIDRAIDADPTLGIPKKYKDYAKNYLKNPCAELDHDHDKVLIKPSWYEFGKKSYTLHFTCTTSQNTVTVTIVKSYPK